MPLYEYRCALGHVFECYEPVAWRAPTVRGCTSCYCLAHRQFPLVNVLQYFSEANGRVIQNLDPHRVLHSHGEHQALMREKGVEPATDWHVSMKRTDGLKTTHPAPHPLAAWRKEHHG